MPLRILLVFILPLTILAIEYPLGSSFQIASNDTGILFINSSSRIASVSAIIPRKIPIVVCRNSFLVYEFSAFFYHHNHTHLSSPILSECGSVIIRALSIYTISSLRSLVDSLFDKGLSYTRNPTVSLISSQFDSLLIESSLCEGSFSCMGNVMSEVVDRCTFRNVTVTETEIVRTKKLVYNRVVWESLLQNSLIVNGEEGIYGEIVSGMSEGTVLSFDCRNCTILNVTRSIFAKKGIRGVGMDVMNAQNTSSNETYNQGISGSTSTSYSYNN